MIELKDHIAPERYTIGKHTIDSVVFLLRKGKVPLYRDCVSSTPSAQVAYLRKLISDLDSEWKTKRGTWPKRLAQALHKAGIPYDDQTLSQCGQIAREDSIVGPPSILRVTDDLDWEPGTFGDGNSCFWTSKDLARRLMRESGGISLQLWTQRKPQKPLARCWALPCRPRSKAAAAMLARGVVKSDDASARIESDINEDSWVIFNAYSACQPPTTLVTFARAFSECNGFTYYRKVSLTSRGMPSGLLWINGGEGYLVGSTAIRYIQSVDLDLGYKCSWCGRECGDATTVTENNEIVCRSCGRKRYTCEYCDARISGGDVCSIYEGEREMLCCLACRNAWTRYCYWCGRGVHKDFIHTFESREMCEFCQKSRVTICPGCGQEKWTSTMRVTASNEYLCANCARTAQKVPTILSASTSDSTAQIDSSLSTSYGNVWSGPIAPIDAIEYPNIDAWIEDVREEENQE